MKNYTHEIMHVLGSPTWCYTIGFPDVLGHPEVVASNVDPSFLNRLSDLIRAGARFTDGASLEGLLRDPVVFRRVPPELMGPEVAACHQHHAGKPFELVQMVWPDAEGRFPWDPGYVNQPKQHQLWRPGGPRGHGPLRRHGVARPVARAPALPVSRAPDGGDWN